MFTPLFDGFSFVSDSFVAEFDIKVNGNGVGVSISSTSNNNKFLWLANQLVSGTPSKVVYYKDSNNSEKDVKYNAMNNNTYYHIKLEYTNSELKVYDETGLLSTITGLNHYNGDTRSIYFGEWVRNHIVTVKNVLIKPL